MGGLSNYLCYDVGVNSWVVIFFNSSEGYCSKQYNSIFYKLKMKNTKKQGKHLGVLFFFDIFRHSTKCRSPFIQQYKIDGEGKDLCKKRIINFLKFDYFCKNSSPRYERENQALFTTAFMQRGGDPLWS